MAEFLIIKLFLGENLIEKMLAHKQALAASANERERLELDANVKVLGCMFLGNKIERLARGK
ncbi:MAG: hypothetical protein ABL962_15420 [Fimbriimonadaceae bacterium]